MTTNRTIHALALLVAMTIIPCSSFGQSQRAPRAPYRSPVSPYINLLRPDQDRRLLYQGIIRPQLEERRFQDFQQREINRLRQQSAKQSSIVTQTFASQQEQLNLLQKQVGPQRIETGHRTSFMSRGAYFPGL